MNGARAISEIMITLQLFITGFNRNKEWEATKHEWGNRKRETGNAERIHDKRTTDGEVRS